MFDLIIPCFALMPACLPATPFFQGQCFWSKITGLYKALWMGQVKLLEPHFDCCCWNTVLREEMLFFLFKNLKFSFVTRYIHFPGEHIDLVLKTSSANGGWNIYFSTKLEKWIVEKIYCKINFCEADSFLSFLDNLNMFITFVTDLLLKVVVTCWFYMFFHLLILKWANLIWMHQSNLILSDLRSPG